MMLCASLGTVRAQWRVGVTGGATYNVFSMDKQYLDDYRIDGRWGVTLGVSGQYDINSWLAVRADLNWTQKNYRKYRVKLYEMDFKYQNNYLQLPVMASLSVGGQKLRGFCNRGVYAGYWLNSYRKGTDYNSFGEYTFGFSENVEFNSDRDKRWDCGFVGGLGLEYRITPHWTAQAELRYYSTYAHLPSMASYTLEKKLVEAEGIHPDIEVDLDIDQYNNTGKDTQLDRALQFIRTGQ